MKRSVTVLFLMFLMLMCATSAQADWFTVSFPIGEQMSASSARLVDSTHMAAEINRSICLIDLTTGESVKLAPRMEGAYAFFCSEKGDIYTSYNDEVTCEEHVYRLDIDTNSWVEEFVIDLNALDIVEEDYASIIQATNCEGKLYLSVGRDNKPNLLASYDLDTGAVTQLGEFSIMSQCTNPLIIVDGGILLFANNESGGYDQFFYSFVQEKIEHMSVQSNVDGLHTIAYDASENIYWAIVRYKKDGSRAHALYTGPALDQLTQVSDDISTTSILPVGGDCILLQADRMMSYHVIENATSHITLANFHTPYDGGFTVDCGISVSTVGTSVSDVLNRQNSNVDLIAFRTDDIPSLRHMKEKGYYVDLSSSNVLTKQAARLYPSLSDALWTNDGKLAAWLINVEPYLFNADTMLLSEYGFDTPSTLPELLDQMRVLVDEGIFNDGEYIPFGLVSYSQQSLIEYTLQRFIFEKEAQGMRLDFNNDDLRSLLMRITSEVPREAMYNAHTGEEIPVYTLYNVYSTIRKQAQMPLKIGENSPVAIQARTQVVVINPYSNHKDEALRYLEYVAQQGSSNDYTLYADMTQPLVRSEVQTQLEQIDSQLAVLQAKESNMDNHDEMAALQAQRNMVEEQLYLIDSEDIAAWHAHANAMVILEESLYTDELSQLVDRLASGSLSVDAFISECNRYVSMVYSERGQ